MSSPLPYRVDNATFFMPPSCSTPLLSWRWNNGRYTKRMSLSRVSSVFFITWSPLRCISQLKPHTDHVLSSTLHLMSAVDNTLDLLHDHGLHHHILSLPPQNITLMHLFRPIYQTLTVVERDVYEESDMRLINCLTSSLFILPVPAPHSPTPTEPANNDPVPSPQSTSLTLIDKLADPRPAFHQGHTGSYSTRVAPHDPRLGLQPITTAATVCFQCHNQGHFCVDGPEYECPHCHQRAPGHPQYHCSRNYCYAWPG